jgi:hypothetical protein
MGPDQPAQNDTLSDIEIQREKQEFAQLKATLKRAFDGMHRRYRFALSVLIDTGAFTEHDLQLMLRGQILSPEGGGPRPCEACDGEEDLKEVWAVERRRCSQAPFGDQPLLPVPVARHLLRCPLHERGKRGDPLVPCYRAQQANPKCPPGRLMEAAPFLPPDLPEPQRQAINFFCDSRTDLVPCRVVQSVIQYDLSHLIEEGGEELLQIRPRPVPPAPAPPPELRGDLELRRHLQERQTVLEEAARLEADAERHRRRILRHLIQTGRLSAHDLSDLAYEVDLVTDEGWLPCRDDPQRTYTPHVDIADDDVDLAVQRLVCPLIVRALEGDTTVPCCEAQKVAASPERMAEIAARQEQARKEYEEFWRKRGGPPPRPPQEEEEEEEEEEERCFAGEADGPGGPQDVVRLLHIRPCYLLGRTAASFLYAYGEFLSAHPEIFAEDEAGDESPPR